MGLTIQPVENSSKLDRIIGCNWTNGAIITALLPLLKTYTNANLATDWSERFWQLAIGWV